MTDEVESLPDPSRILPNFLDWIKPIQLSENREDVLRRWKTIERIFIDSDNNTDIDDQWINNLILSALSDAPIKPEVLEHLRVELKKDDFMYASSPLSVEEELRVLSSYCLSLIADDKYFDNDSAVIETTKILSASLNGLRSFKGGGSLYNLLSHYSFHYSRNQRIKPDLKSPTLYYNKSTEYQASSTQLETNAQNPAFMSDFITHLSKNLDRQLSNASNAMSNYVTKSNKVIRILEEEQEILWLVNLSWNDEVDSSYESIERDKKILLLSLELKNKTKIFAELPSIKAIARKIGVEDTEIVFREWIDKNVKDLPKAISSVFDKASEITPVLLGLKLASDGSWYKKWNSLIGIDSKITINSLDLTLQVYRELLTIEWGK
jgi:hypothetical protein